MAKGPIRDYRYYHSKACWALQEVDHKAKRRRSCAVQLSTCSCKDNEEQRYSSPHSLTGSSLPCEVAPALDEDSSDAFPQPPVNAVALTHLTINGTKLRQGDSAYVVTSADFDWNADTREPCALCGQLPEAEDSPAVECDNCLRGYHVSCLGAANSGVSLQLLE